MASLYSNKDYRQMLDKVQMAGLSKDSKTFVDKPMKYSLDITLEAFHKSTNIAEFVENYFTEEGQEMETWKPTDFNPNPSLVEKIKSPVLKEFLTDLNNKWQLIGRKINRQVKEEQERFSLIYLPEPFIIPGGRFREIYYWDSYWIILGLLRYGMTSTVKSMITNLLYLVEQFGMVPNGGRMYYLNRSQPPLLISMMYEYYKEAHDTTFLRSNFHLLEKEYDYWMRDKCVSINYKNKTYTLNRYYVNTSEPRPESYREDKMLAESVQKEVRADFYSNIASAAESGWDFSSRWFRDEPPNNESPHLNLTTTTEILPIDLNSYLCRNERILSEFAQVIGDDGKSEYYHTQYERRVEAISHVFWDEGLGSWFDFDLSKGKRRTEFYMSTITPLFVDCHGTTSEQKCERMETFSNYIQSVGIENFQYGIPTSLQQTGEQWDQPNSWPPLMHMWIKGMIDSGNMKLVDMGRHLAQKWLNTTLAAWQPKGHMFEKYNAVDGRPGSGGEYEVQIGFGWTNGAIIDILHSYPDLQYSLESKPRN